MAGDWIKMRTNLDTDPRICELSTALNLPNLYVVGCLWKLWAWADEHTIDGNAVRVTEVTLDRFTGVTGFAAELRKVGWLEGRDSALSFPRFAEHNGQTAKNRALTAKRVAEHKARKGNAETVSGALPREEKRREEYLRTKDRPIIPKNLDCQEFMESWGKWKSHRNEKMKPLGVIEEESQLSTLSQNSASEASKIVLFSIQCGAVNLILNGDHEQKPKQPKASLNNSTHSVFKKGLSKDEIV